MRILAFVCLHFVPSENREMWTFSCFCTLEIYLKKSNRKIYAENVNLTVSYIYIWVHRVISVSEELDASTLRVVEEKPVLFTFLDCLEGGGSRFLRSVGTYILVYMGHISSDWNFHSIALRASCSCRRLTWIRQQMRTE